MGLTTGLKFDNCSSACPPFTNSTPGADEMTDCDCYPNFIGVDGERCYDLLECVNTPGKCLSIAVCHQSVKGAEFASAHKPLILVSPAVGVFCAASVKPGTLSLLNGTTISTDPLVLNTTLGGHVLSFDVDVGNTTSIRNVRFGRDELPFEMSCSTLVISNISASIKRITCRVGAGYGKDYFFSVESCLMIAGVQECRWHTGDQNFSYPAPTLTPCTLHLSELGLNVTNCTDHIDLQLPTTLSRSLSFFGTELTNNPDFLEIVYVSAARVSL